MLSKWALVTKKQKQRRQGECFYWLATRGTFFHLPPPPSSCTNTQRQDWDEGTGRVVRDVAED